MGLKMTEKKRRSFGRLRIAELGGSAAGGYCGKLFADFGAEVALIGDGPTGPGAAFYTASKHHLAVDDPAVPAVLADADIVIQSSNIDGLDALLDPATPEQIVLRVSPFPASGPYSGWRATDLVDAAVAGHLRLSGDPEREPLQGVRDIVHHAAGAVAFITAVAALIARVRGGVGQTAEVSHQETLTALHQFSLLRYTHTGAILNRLGNRYAGPGAPIGGYECADGWVGMSLPQTDQMERMLDVTGLVSMLELDGIDEILDLMTNIELLDSQLVPYLKTQTRDELVELFQLLRLPCAPVFDLKELLADDHLAARQFWQRPDSGAILHPGAPFTMSDHDWSIGPKAAGAERFPTSAATSVVLSDGPLTGLRVIDMTRVWAGPLATRILGDLGAEVVMTEVPWTRTPREVPDSYVHATHFFPDDDAGDRPWNRSGFHNKYAINKLSTVIELDKPEGRELFASLVPTADVLVENYSPRVMPEFGFDGESLLSMNPDLVYVTMPGYGRDGPHVDWVAYGPTIDGHVGHTSLTGYRGEGPWKCGVAWPDPIGGLHGAAAALVGLLDRLVAPEQGGQVIEVAQVEAAINMIGQHVVAAQTNGQPERLGNRHPSRAPQGVYPCGGDDRWIAISVVDEQSWHGLCDTFGWSDLRDLTFDERRARHDEIDELLSTTTLKTNDVELMHQLQACGVPAGAVLDAADVMTDPQLAAVNMFAGLDHSDAGLHEWPRFPGRLSATPATMRSPAALMGEHNEYVLQTLTGISTDAYDELFAAGVIRDDPPY
jgi:crotonobetainyl-CoA:carnitine CoA-transferase CaiB-like acyl-CoA transferase